MKKYTISIPEPCTVTFNEMTPVEGGRFCGNCQQRVVDFTGMTDQQMVTYFQKHGNCCGSFHPSQLNRPIQIQSSHKRWIPAALLTGMLALVIPEPGKAQQKQITGTIFDSTDCEPVQNVIIALIDGQKSDTITKTTSQPDGTFSLLIPEHYSKEMHLKLFCHGYDTVNLAISPEQFNTSSPMQVQLKRDGNWVTFGGAIGISYRTTWWQRLKWRVFR